MTQEQIRAGEESSEALQKQLHVFLREQVASHLIEEQDMFILSLRLGLNREKCSTLIETGHVLHLSPECVRQRQHFLLRRKIKSPLFFQLLKAYAHTRKLPPGFAKDNF